MTTAWAIAPYESTNPSSFDKAWGFDLTNDVISIGWPKLGDVSTLSKEHLFAKVAKTFPESPLATQSLFANMLWAFYHDIKVGDIVVARRGRKALVGIGHVTAPAYFAPGKNPQVPEHPHFLPVHWDPAQPGKTFDSLIFPMHTLWELPQERYEQVVQGPGPVIAGSANAGVESSTEFVLEKYLEDFLVTNFDSIFKGQLALFGDKAELEGQQYPTDVGPIDVLAVDPSTGDLVVIELKKGRPSDQVVGQVLRYMGWVKNKLCAPNQHVRGLIICQHSDAKLTYALQMVPNVAIRFYRVDFTLTSAS